MPDLAESSLEFYDQPVYDEYLASVGEAQLDLVGQVSPDPVVSVPPNLSGWSPALGTAITKKQVLSFSVQPATPNPMRRVVLLVSFPQLNTYEVVHDGDGFTTANYPAALGNVRTAVGDGFTFSVLRVNGWPASPRLVPMAVDIDGAINPISSVSYAWTLLDEG